MNSRNSTNFSMLLQPFALLYELLARLDRRRKLRAAKSFPMPIISVGAITAGGSGKTPVTEALLRLLLGEYQVIVLSRGYGRKESRHIIWREGDELPNPDAFGDEPTLLTRSIMRSRQGSHQAKKLGPSIVAVGSDRASLLETILATLSTTQPSSLSSSSTPIVLLDDGFQHARIKRDLDIVIVDDRTASERFLLPAGYLRERPTALTRAQILLTTGPSALKLAQRYAAPNTHIFPVGFRPGKVIRWMNQEVLEDIENENVPQVEKSMQTVLLVSGIARPERVKISAEEKGYWVARHMVFADHHRYTKKDVDRIREAARMLNVNMILTTEKDAVKLEHFPALQESLYVLTIAVDLPDAGSLLNIIRDGLRNG